jgi:acetylornithine deacetylase
MKGGVAAGLAALMVLREAGIRLAGDVIFESVVDEETGGPGTRATIDRGYRADAAIVLEPTSGALVPVQGGLYWANVIVRGIGGHSGARYRSIHARGQGTSVNAIDKAAKVLLALEELERNWANRKMHPLMPPNNTINPGMIAGGTGEGPRKLPSTFSAYANMADYCIIGLDIKYLPNERAEDVRREFAEYLAAVARTDPWLAEHPPEIEWEANGLHFPPCDTPLDHPLLLAAADAYRAHLGEPVWSGYEAVTDLGFLAAAGVPGLIYGPGSIPRSHGADEYIELDDLRSSVKVLATTLATFCGVA